MSLNASLALRLAFYSKNARVQERCVLKTQGSGSTAELLQHCDETKPSLVAKN